MPDSHTANRMTPGRTGGAAAELGAVCVDGASASPLGSSASADSVAAAAAEAGAVCEIVSVCGACILSILSGLAEAVEPESSSPEADAAATEKVLCGSVKKPIPLSTVKGTASRARSRNHTKYCREGENRFWNIRFKSRTSANRTAE